jgi:hypothetical protein
MTKKGALLGMTKKGALLGMTKKGLLGMTKKGILGMTGEGAVHSFFRAEKGDRQDRRFRRHRHLYPESVSLPHFLIDLFAEFDGKVEFGGLLSCPCAGRLFQA